LKVEFTEKSTVRKCLTFEIEPEVVQAEIAKEAGKAARKARIPGFRPGKVPAELFRQRFRAVIHDEVADAIIKRVLFDEIEGRGLRPIAPPEIKDLRVSDHGPMTFRAEFEVLPLIELPDYRNVEVRTRTVQVGETDVDGEIEKLRQAAARLDPVDGRPSAAGDIVVADLSWRAASESKGQRSEDALVEIGAPEHHADLSAALTGVEPGATGSLTVSYPSDHANTSFAGQTVSYTYTVKAIKTRVVPALDDDLAKDLGDWESLAELREGVRQRLVAVEERKLDAEIKSAILDALCARSDFEVPDALVERHMNARTQNVATTLALQGVDPRNVGIDWREFRSAQRDEAAKAAKAEVLLREIMSREGIEVPDAELEAEITRIAERRRRPRESVRLRLDKDGEIEALRARIREDKTLDLLKANARLIAG
jgi:trigger factor